MVTMEGRPLGSVQPVPALWVRVLAALILFLPLSAHRVKAQTVPLPQLQSADPFMADLFHRSRSTGMVVVVVRDHGTWMQSYAQTYPGSHQKPNADSLIRLCSLTKIMTTDLLVKLVADGRVSLSDPLQKFAPHNVTVPVRTVSGLSGRPMTLRDLATHTAGLPREIAYPAGDSGHFTFPDYNFRWQWLPGYRLRFLPGTAAHYSNIGFDLLAFLLGLQFSSFEVCAKNLAIAVTGNRKTGRERVNRLRADTIQSDAELKDVVIVFGACVDP